MRKYYRRLALKRIIFCFIYTIFIIFLINYCGDRYSITTSNITTVKSIESNRMKPRVIENKEKVGKINYVYKSVPYDVNCLEKSNIIKNNLYHDSVYGDVYILKTNSSYLCKSILKIKKDDLEIYGIVLDKDSKLLKSNIEILTNNLENYVFEDEEDIIFTVERYGD